METPFAELSEFHQTLYVDKLPNRINHPWQNPSELEDSIGNLLHSAKNNYIKRTILKFLIECALTDQLNNDYFALAIFARVLKEETDPLLINSAIRFEALLTRGNDTSFVNTLNSLSNDGNGDISSEAFYWLGMFEFRKLHSSDLKRTIEVFDAAEKFFTGSYKSTENRVDALFYLLLIRYLRAVTVKDYALAQEKIDALTILLFDRLLFNLDDSRNEKDIITQEVLLLYHESFCKLNLVDQWLDFQKEFSILQKLNESIEKIAALNSTENVVYQNFIHSMLEQVSNGVNANSLDKQGSRIEQLRNTPGLNGFMDKLSRLVEANLSNQRNPELMGLLHEIQSDPVKANCEYDRLVQVTDLGALLVELRDMVKKNPDQRIREFIAQSPQGEDVYKHIQNEIKTHLPNFPPDKLSIFMLILEEVIRYSHRTLVGSSKADFLFLYAASEGGKGLDAMEGDLQDNMFEYLKRGRLAFGLEHEKAKFTDGGRVDIVFHQDAATFPIEIKRSFEFPTDDDIKTKYIAQAQTYAAGYDQLGICAILDLSHKGTQPTINFKDWFGFHHIQSTVMNLRHPDYVVSVIIPGNKTLPSSKSLYSKKPYKRENS